ncbi:MAG: AsmA-like C-terminal domain-containing protein [Thermodesulfobacteriota bacterium]
MLISSVKRILKKPSVVAITFAALLSVFALLSLVPIDLTPRIPQIKAEIENRINGRVDIGGMDLRVLPFPRLNIKDFSLYDKREEIFKAETIKAGVGFFGLLFKEIEIKSLSLDNASAIVRRDAEGVVNFAKIPKGSVFTISLKKLTLKNGSIKFFDEKAEGSKFEVKGLLVRMSAGKDGFSYSVDGNLLPGTPFHSKGSAKNKDSATMIDGTLNVKDFTIERAAPYVKDAAKLGTLKGSVSAELSYSFAGKPLAKDGILKGKGVVKGAVSTRHVELDAPRLLSKTLHSTEGSSVMEVSWDDKFIGFSLDKTSLKVEDFEIGGKVKFSSPDKTIELDVHSTPVSIAYIKDFLNPDVVPGGIKRASNDIGQVEGGLALKKLYFKKTAGPETNSAMRKLSIDISLKDIGFSYKPFKERFHGINGDASIEEGVVKLTAIRGNYGKTALNDLSGEITGIFDSPNMKFTLDASIDANEAIAELKDIPSLKTFKDLDVVGITKLKASCDGGALVISEKSKNTPPLKIDIAIDLSQNGIAYKRLIEKSAGTTLVVNSSLTVKENSFEGKGSLKLGTSSVTVDSVFSRKVFSSTIRFKGKDMLVTDMMSISPYFERNSPSLGTINLDIVRKRVPEGERLFYNGELRVSNALFETHFLEKTFRDVNAVMRLDGNTGTVVIENAKIGTSDISGKLNIIDLSKNIVDFNLFSNHLDTADMATAKGRNPLRADDGGETGTPEARDAGTPITGRGRISAKHGFIQRISYTALSAEAVMGKDAVNISPIIFTSHGGQVEGKAVLFRDKKSPNLMEASFNVSRVRVAGIFKDLGAKEDILTGRLTAEAKVNIKRGASPMSEGLNGEINLSAKDGKLKKFLVLTKIFSIVNILTVTELFNTGMPYGSIDGKFRIKDGILSTDNFFLESNSLRMSAVGEIDIPKETMDSTLGLHPFVTIDKIISNIPLAGWIIGGREKSTITMYYKISGPMKNLEVEAIPISGMGKKILGIFERIFTAPIRGMGTDKEKKIDAAEPRQ